MVLFACLNNAKMTQEILDIFGQSHTVNPYRGATLRLKAGTDNIS